MVIYSSEDRILFASILREGCRSPGAPLSTGALALEMGKRLLGTPYGAHTLEGEGPEDLVVNLRRMDCFTLIENALAMARLIQSGRSSFADYAAELAAIRYRKGRMEGYPSRLHYFTDWLFDNRRKGIVRDRTRALGGQPYRKKIDFMTRHADRYPALRDRDACRKMAAVERILGRRRHRFIPKASVKGIESRIADGDLIAVTASAEGLDVAHVGLAARVNGRVRLLHASSAAGQVLLSGETLARWLAGNRNGTGIIVARAVEPAGSGRRDR